MPAHLGTGPEAVLAFNRALIEATSDLAVAYKPNVAFYESMGADGWDVLQQTLAAIPDGCLRIADAKRGDIGNTATRYARAAFEAWGADAVTVALTWDATAWSLSSPSRTNGPSCWPPRPIRVPRIMSSTERNRASRLAPGHGGQPDVRRG